MNGDLGNCKKNLPIAKEPTVFIDVDTCIGGQKIC